MSLTNELDKETERYNQRIIRNVKEELGEETYNILNDLKERGFTNFLFVDDEEAGNLEKCDNILDAVQYGDYHIYYYDEYEQYDNLLYFGYFCEPGDAYYDDEYGIYSDVDTRLSIYLQLKLDSTTNINGTKITVAKYIIQNYPNSKLAKAISDYDIKENLRKFDLQKIKKLNEELNRLLEYEEITYNWVQNLDSKSIYARKGKGGFKTIEEAKQNLLDFIQDRFGDADIGWYDPEYDNYYSDDPAFVDTGENGILSLSFEWTTYEAEDTETFYIVPEGYVTNLEKFYDKIREFDSKYRKLQYETNKKIYALFEPFDFLSLTHHSGRGPIIEMCKHNSSSKIIYLWFYTDVSGRYIGVENRISVEGYINYAKGANRNIIDFLKYLTSLNYNTNIFNVKQYTEEGYNKIVEEYDKLYETAVKARDLIKKYEKDLSEYADENNILRGKDRRMDLT